MTKARITISVDERYVQAAKTAVRSGRADSVSAWVEAAMAEHAARETHFKGMRRFLDEYQAEFGTFTAEELEQQERDDMEAAERVRLDGMRRRGEL